MLTAFLMHAQYYQLHQRQAEGELCFAIRLLVYVSPACVLSTFNFLTASLLAAALNHAAAAVTYISSMPHNTKLHIYTGTYTSDQKIMVIYFFFLLRASGRYIHTLRPVLDRLQKPSSLLLT